MKNGLLIMTGDGFGARGGCGGGGDTDLETLAVINGDGTVVMVANRGVGASSDNNGPGCRLMFFTTSPENSERETRIAERKRTDCCKSSEPLCRRVTVA